MQGTFLAEETTPEKPRGKRKLIEFWEELQLCKQGSRQ